MGKTKTAFIGDTLEAPKTKKAHKAAAQKIRAPGQKGGERVKMVEVEMPEIITSETPGKAAAAKRKLHIRGKKYKENKAKVDHARLYSLSEAVKLVKETSFSSFDGTVELHLVVRKEGLSAKVELPHSTGKTKKVEIADDTTLEKLQKNKIDFDVLLATAEMMPKLVPFARILGPKGLMPNPKNGTLIKDAKDAKKFSTNTLQIKTEKKAPLIHTVIAKVSMADKDIIENLESVITGVTERQILKAYLKSTMSPSVKLQVN